MNHMSQTMVPCTEILPLPLIEAPDDSVDMAAVLNAIAVMFDHIHVDSSHIQEASRLPDKPACLGYVIQAAGCCRDV